MMNKLLPNSNDWERRIASYNDILILKHTKETRDTSMRATVAMTMMNTTTTMTSMTTKICSMTWKRNVHSSGKILSLFFHNELLTPS